MKVILFGATGMVGQGVLRECLLYDDIESVVTIGRTSPGKSHTKLHELLRNDLFDFGGVAGELQGYDACFFCLGVSSAGMTETEYTRLTYDLTIGWANELARINPSMTFIYVSGAGTGGKSMWAQVKGRTEKALIELFPKFTCSASQRCGQCMVKYRKHVGHGSCTASLVLYGQSCRRSRPGP